MRISRYIGSAQPWVIMLLMIGMVAATFGWVSRGGDAFDAVMMLALPVTLAYLVLSVWETKFQSRSLRAALDHGVEHSAPFRLAVRAYHEVRRYRAPSPFRETGAIGDLSRLNAPGVARRSGRQSSAAGPARRSAAGSKSSSDDDGDGGNEPPHPHPPRTPRASVAQSEKENFPLLRPIWYRAEDVALHFGYSTVKTFRNQVSCGKMPRPVLLPCGPRWHRDTILAIESGEWQPTTTIENTRRGRGRPRTAGRQGVRS